MVKRRSFIKTGILWLPALASGQVVLPHRRGAGRPAGGAAAYSYDATNFDGTNDHMERDDELTDNADSALGFLSVWFKMAATGVDRYIYANLGNRVEVRMSAGNLFRINGTNSGGTTILDLRTVNTYTSTTTWYHVLASWDMADTAKRHLYINDTSDLTAPTYTNAAVDYTRTDHAVGAQLSPSVGNRWNGCLAEVCLGWGQYYDFSQASERRKFDDGGSPLKPVDLGAIGTGARVYLKNPAASFGTNTGLGGNFNVTGTLDACADEP